jgi:hypothetical protein
MSITISSIIDFTSEYAKDHILAYQEFQHQQQANSVKSMDHSSLILANSPKNQTLESQEKPLESRRTLANKNTRSHKKRSNSASLQTCTSTRACSTNETHARNAQDVLFTLIEDRYAKYQREENMISFVKEHIPLLQDFIIRVKSDSNGSSSDHELFCAKAKCGSELSRLDRQANSLNVISQSNSIERARGQ